MTGAINICYHWWLQDNWWYEYNCLWFKWKIKMEEIDDESGPAICIFECFITDRNTMYALNSLIVFVLSWTYSKNFIKICYCIFSNDANRLTSHPPTHPSCQLWQFLECLCVQAYHLNLLPKKIWMIFKSPQYTGGDFMFLYRFVRRRLRRRRRRPQILVHAITFEQLFGFLSFLAQLLALTYRLPD